MDYVLSSLSFDFGSRRASANIQRSGPGFSFFNVAIPIDPPADLTAKALEDYIVTEIRKAVEQAAKFSYVKTENGAG